MPNSPDDTEAWDTMFAKLSNRPYAKVLVIISDNPVDYWNVMEQLVARDLTGNFYIMATDGWPMQDEAFTEQYKDHIKGKA